MTVRPISAAFAEFSEDPCGIPVADDRTSSPGAIPSYVEIYLCLGDAWEPIGRIRDLYRRAVPSRWEKE